MVVAILSESDVCLSDELLENIIDKACNSEIISYHFLSYTFIFVFAVNFDSLYRHLPMPMPTKMGESAKKNGRLLYLDIHQY